MKFIKKYSSGHVLKLVLWLSLGLMPLRANASSGDTEEITIFIHGVLGSRFSISFYHLFNLVRDKTENTVYEKAIDGIRNDPFFYQNQPIAEPGLKKLDIEDLRSGNTAMLAACLYDAVDCINPSILRARCALGTQGERERDSSSVRGECSAFPQEMTNVSNHQRIKHSYYTYGWSGLLSQKAREKEGEEFLVVLEKLLEESKNRNYVPKLRLIGFSHGGNICAQLGHAHLKNGSNPSFTIDELILIGTPILEETKIVLQDPLFKQVYNVYSLADSIQTKEIFSGQLFSGRKFEATKEEPLPIKLTQIELHVQKNKIKTNRYTKTVKNFGAVDYSPGHMELWFFGWTPNHYRTDYPLHPLPTFVFIPHIIHELNTLKVEQQDLVITLHPEQNTMHIGSHKQQFIQPAVLQKLKQMALAYAPEAYSLTEYRQHCKDAYWTAREERAPLAKRQ